MAPKNTKHGASASSRRASAGKSARSTASSRSRASSSARSGSTARAGSSTRAKSSATRKARTAPQSPSKRTPAAAKRPARTASVPRQWWTLPLVICAVVAIFGWTYYPVAAVQYRESRERARLAAELESLQARNERLREQVDRLKTPAGVEDYARSQLGLVKKGENVVVVIDGDEDKAASRVDGKPQIDSEEGTATPVGPWTAFLDLVFGVQ